MPRPNLQRYAPWLYLPDGWDATWRAAKSNAGSTPARILHLGDSLPTGNSVSTFAKSYGELLAANLVSRYGRYGDYWAAMLTPDYSTPSDSPWSGALNSTAFSSIGTIGWHMQLYSGTVSSAIYRTFTSPYACTSMEIHYVDCYPGSWQYQVDGGTAQTVTNSSGAASAANYTSKKVTISSLANTTHTLNFLNQSSNAAMMIQGVACYTNNSGGIYYSRFLGSGDKIHNYQYNSGYPLDRAGLLTGKSPQNDATADSGNAYGYPLGPHLYICQLFVNSVGNSDTAGELRDIQYQLAAAHRRAQQGASVLFIIPCYPFGSNNNGQPGPYDVTQDASHTNNGHTVGQYILEVYHAAQVLNAGVLNIHAKWGSTPGGQGFMQNANIHPIDAGHADIANALISIL
ncbi:MAG TPA: hypothetical protein VKX16_10350 [Chloroflexota bacterium]|nr:hypothetical protein [Chloroflexota bacterium]